jgi:hypothetical protein
MLRKLRALLAWMHFDSIANSLGLCTASLPASSSEREQLIYIKDYSQLLLFWVTD